MNNIKKLVSVFFSAILLFSATITSSIAIEKIHFVIGGGAGGGWDGTARGTGEALTKAGMLKSASFENMSGGGGGKALAYMINTKPANTILVQSTPLVLRSITRHKGYLKGNIEKYMWRYENKKGLQDVLKAEWYLKRLIKTLEKEETLSNARTSPPSNS